MRVINKLMSGFPWTSSSNSVLNRCILRYLVLRTRYPYEPAAQLARRHLDALFEGDDGITEASHVDPALLKGLGVLLKFEMLRNYGEASFCGIVSPLDADTNLTDPLKVLSGFGILPSKYGKMRAGKWKAFLRCKALSYAYQYPACPVVSEFAHYVLRCTRGVDHRPAVADFDWWQRQGVEVAVNAKVYQEARQPIDEDARQLVAERWGITVHTQLRLEALFASRTDLAPYPADGLPHNEAMAEYATYYFVPVDGRPAEYARDVRNLCEVAKNLTAKSLPGANPGAVLHFPAR